MNHNNQAQIKRNFDPSPPIAQLIEQLQAVLAKPEAFDHQVTRYLPAPQLAQKLDLELGDKACTESELISALQTYLRYTPKTWRPEFNKLLFSGLDGSAVLADWVSSFSNTTMHTYQVAPVASLMELEIIRQLNGLIGFDSKDNKGDGVMVSGGSMANMVAMMLARHQKCPDIKDQGFSGKPLVAYVSELAHYSYDKAANVLGIGRQNLIGIKTDHQGRLLPESLEQEISQSFAQGKQPFFIGLTAGTTVIGSFDRVSQCAEIAQQYGLWLHIDGAWGGPVLFSARHRHLLRGSHLADSFTWDAHKLMNIPLTASLILVKNPAILQQCCSGGGGAYLFHEDENAAYNLGTKSLPCGRRVDSLKLWLSWKAVGAKAYAEKIERLMSLKEIMLERVNVHPSLHRLAPASFLNVLFRFEPTTQLNESKLAQLNQTICKQMLKEDSCFVDYAQYKGQLGIRFILANNDLNEKHIDQFLHRCVQIGNQLSNSGNNHV